MITVGLKLTHDAAVAAFDGNKLLFSIEAEKIANAPRYSKFHTWGEVYSILHREGIAPRDVDQWAIDGWKHGLIDHFEEPLEVAGYFEWDWKPFVNPTQSRRIGPYASYTHVNGHIIGSLMMSPAPTDVVSYVLVWDGGMTPCLYSVTGNDLRSITFIANIHWLNGVIYGIASYYFGPYAKNDVRLRSVLPDPKERLMGGYSTPGKLMSWMGFGMYKHELQMMISAMYRQALDENQRTFAQGYHQDGSIEHALCSKLFTWCVGRGVSESDAFYNLHRWLEARLVMFIERHVPADAPLIFTGGSALNIKWNSALRRTRPGLTWVPPIPNDAGSALGAAACLISDQGAKRIEWTPFRGPNLIRDLPTGWKPSTRPAGEALASGEIVPRLAGRAEIGPRALGHRSLLADPFRFASKERLNKLKGREPWRPVAPICTEHGALRNFNPGTPDPYMLFDHRERDTKMKALSHSDATARIQTVTRDSDPYMYDLLVDFGRRAGEEVLCNTSANLPGCGFFPAVSDAARWSEANGLRFMIVDDRLYERDV